MLLTPIVRATILPRAVASGTAETLLLAGGGNRAAYHFDGQHWRAGLVDIPRFRTAIGFDENGWTGGVIPTTGRLRWAPSRTADYVTYANGYVWKGAQIAVELGMEGPEGSAPVSWQALLVGTIADMSADEGMLSFVIADLSVQLNKPMLEGRFFAGTGGVEGPIEIANRVKRRSWGRVFNVEGRILDPANSIYEFGDPARRLESFEAVRDMGRLASPAPTVLAWQGSVAATFTALQTATAAQGSGVVAPSIACVKWWTQPAGPLTADIRGESNVEGGQAYVETPAAIAARILAAAGGPAANAASLTEAITARPDAAGIHVGDTGISWASALDRLLQGVSLGWVVSPTGEVFFRPFTFTGPVATLDSLEARRLKALPPVKRRKLGFRRNERQHNDGEIAASVAAGLGEELGDLASEDFVYFGGPYLKETDNGVDATLGDFKTGMGTAAGFVGQQALATKATADFSTDVSGTKPYIHAGRVLDTRLDNLTPAQYRSTIFPNGVGLVAEFKLLSVIGLPSSGSAFALTETESKWADDSGGAVNQRAVNDAGVVYERTGTNAAGWGAWQISYSGAYKPIFGADLREDANTIATLAAFRTSLGTAAGFVGQQALATGAYIQLGIADSAGVARGLVDQNWSFWISNTHVITTLGTAAGFAGQGGLATKNGGGFGNIWEGDSSFESYLPASQPKADGGGLSHFTIEVAPANNPAPHGNKFLRLGGIGAHMIGLPDTAFTAQATSVTLSAFIKDSGIANTWVGTAVNQAGPLMLAIELADNGTSSTFVANQSFAPSTNGLWQRVSYTATGLTPGTRYRLAMGSHAYLGNRLLDVDAIQIEYGDTASQYQFNRANRIAFDGRVYDPRLYNTQAIVGVSSATNLAASYSGTGPFTVNLPAHSRTIAGPQGAITINYGGGSFSVNANEVWHAFIDDPMLEGIVSPIIQKAATQSGLIGPHRYHLASGVAPAQGQTGGPIGGGGGYVPPDCVAVDSFMFNGCLAGEVRADDPLLVLDYATMETTRLEPCTANRVALADCVEIETASGIRLVVSTTAPLTLRDGSCILAPLGLGHAVPVLDADGFRWENIVALRPAGERPVAHISASDATYAAGAEPGRFIFTHNSTAKP
jgi:hypothetical protein